MPARTNNVTPSESSAALSCAMLAASDRDAWARAISDVAPRTRFFTDTWMPLLQSTYGFEPMAVLCQQGGQTIGLLPLVLVKSAFTGTRGVSLPFIDFCHSFYNNKETYLRLYAELKRYGKEQGWDYIELRGDFRYLEEQEPSLSFYNHVVDLSGSSEDLFKRLKSSNQRAIRKARKDAVQVEESRDLSAIDAFFELQCLTRKRHGLPPQPYAFFKNLHQQIIAPGAGSVVTAYHEGEAVSSSVYIQQGDIVHYKYGASDYRFQNTRCNNLVMWTALELYAQRGFKALHLGRNSLDNEGLRRYKLSWGSKEGLTRYHRYNLKKDQIEPMSDDVYGWHNTIFRKLPRPLSKLAGALLYRHIA